MRKFDLSLRSSRSSYFATFRHQLTILSKTDALDEEKWLNMLGTFVKDWFRYDGAERMPHDLSHLGFLAGQIGRLITISTTPVIAGDSFEMDAVGALRLSPLRRGLAIDSTV